MNRSPTLEDKEKEIPRWIQVPVGLVLGLFTFLCGLGALTLLMAPPEKNPLLGIIIGFVLLLGCLWVMEKCLRLLTGRKKSGGLMTPRALRVISLFFLVLPVGGLFTGYYRSHASMAIVQVVADVSIFFRLRALARSREAEEKGGHV